MPSQKAILLIVLLAAAAFANTLSNGFVGDDHGLFVGNAFYTDWRHLPRLFSKDFILTAEDLAAGQPARDFSGAVSYRPVTGLTFFIDYFLWRNNPAGYHLTNLILHLGVCAMVFVFLRGVAGRPETVWAAAAVFAVHPVHSELVSSIAYRSDLLCALFVLIAFFGHRLGRIGWAAAGLAAALLAKETAVVFPLLAAAHDGLLRSPGTRLGEVFWTRRRAYAAYAAVTIAYLAIYTFIFPNINASEIFGAWATLGPRLVVSLWIWARGAVALLWPPAVGVIPPLYAPVLSRLGSGEIVGACVLLGCWLGLAVIPRRRSVVAFAAFWFLVSYLPTANIIPLPNPMAYRYFYIPAVGFCLAVGGLLEWAAARLARCRPGVRWKWVLPATVALALIPLSWRTNAHYRDNFTVSRAMVEFFPDAPKPWWVLGQNYLGRGQTTEAAFCFRNYLQLPQNQLFLPLEKNEYYVHWLLGRCYDVIPVRALAQFETAVALEPGFAPGWADIARVHAAQGRPAAALKAARRGLEADAEFLPLYIFALESSLRLGHNKDARQYLREIKVRQPDNGLARFFEEILKRQTDAGTE